MSTTPQTTGNLATLDMLLQPVNDRIDTLNGEEIAGGVPGKMDKLDNTKEAIRQVINQKGVAITTDEPFAVYPDKIAQLPELPTDDWQPNPTWWDIETILNEDTRDYAYKSIYLYTDNHSTIQLYGAKAYATSDGAFYTSDVDHTWDTTQDKPYTENGHQTYSTRYVIVYSDKPQISYPSSSSGLTPLLGAIIKGNYDVSINFLGSSTLQFVKHGKELNKLAVSAFAGCNNLRSVILPESLSELSINAFTGCCSLRSIVLPSQITTIPKGAFANCYSLSSLKLPDGITSIGEGAFTGCNNMSTLHLPNSLTTIGIRAFAACFGLAKIEIPDSVTSIGHSCFESCSSLSKVVLSENLQTLERNLFVGCTSLPEINIPSSVTSIENRVFGGTMLTSIMIPPSVTFLAYDFLYNSTYLNSIIFCNTTNTYTSEPMATSSYLYYAEIPENFDMSLSISSSYLSVTALLRILANLKDNTGLAAKTIRIGTRNMSQLNDEQKAIATNKNWVLA